MLPFLTVAWDNYYKGLVIWNQHQFKIVKIDRAWNNNRSMIGGKAGFRFPTWKKQGIESHDCRSPSSGTLRTLFQFAELHSQMFKALIKSKYH
jgi:hypothetical protein